MFEAIKRYIKERDIGFYLTLVTALAMIVLLVIYPAFFSRGVHWSSWPIIFIILGLVLGLLLYVFKLDSWAPVAMGLGLFSGLLFFILGAWYMIQDAFGGYEDFGLSTGFKVVFVFFIIGIVISMVNIIGFRQKKETK